MTSPLYPTTEARRSLATRLQLPYSDGMQDWEWEVADANRFVEFVSVYERAPLDLMERFSLMEIIVQCAEDVADTPAGPAVWSEVERLLWTHPEVHVATVRYWACLEDQSEAESFLVAPKMREVWATMSLRGR